MQANKIKNKHDEKAGGKWEEKVVVVVINLRKLTCIHV